jgi:hypothetical protein
MGIGARIPYFIRYKYDHDSSVTTMAVDIVVLPNDKAEDIVKRIEQKVLDTYSGYRKERLNSIESITKLI